MARFFILISNLIIAMTTVVNGFDLKCKIQSGDFGSVEKTDVCYAQNVNILSMNEEITSMNGRTEPTSLKILYIYGQTVYYLPKGIDKFFPNLKVLYVVGSKLKSLTQDDLKPFTQLSDVSFYANDLESLDSDLFKFNLQLKYVSFDSNNIKYVSESFLSSLKDLEQLNFRENPCLNDVTAPSSAIPAFLEKLRLQCKWPQDPVLLRKINQLNQENAELKNQTKQQMIELNSANSNVSSLQDENAKLKRWLKSCDGNLNSATGILFKTSDRPQIFIQPIAESFGLIVAVDGFKVTASELIISSLGSKVSSVKNASGSVVDNNATELYIDHQQTLFLPTNLAQHFPVLQVLTVTSSGLIQIDSSVFSLMKNLKVLNLNNNKLQEIQPRTFDQLKLLESLDLSSNYLKSLESSAIIGLGKLQVLNLAGNRLKVVSYNILDTLKVLKSVDLSNNDCINLSYPKVTLKEIKDKLIQDCFTPLEIECSMRGLDCKAVNLTIIQPQTKVAKLKNQIGIDSSTFSIIDQRISFLPNQLNNIFKNLQVFVVVRSQLTAFLQHDFEGLKSLTNITVNYNNITLIEAGVFDDVPQLEHLNLSYNNIHTLPSMIFVKLVQLKTLNLSYNYLQSFLSELLPSISVIEELRIKDNEIIKINLANSINLKNVKIVDLTHNICINLRYEKGKAGGITLPKLIQALQVCKN